MLHKKDSNNNSIISQDDLPLFEIQDQDLVIYLDRLTPQQLKVVRDFYRILNMPPGPDTDGWLVCFWALLPDRLTDEEYASVLQMWGL
jgi:hypothetical protein